MTAEIEHPTFTGEELATIRDLAFREMKALESDTRDGATEQQDVVFEIVSKVDAAFRATMR